MPPLAEGFIVGPETVPGLETALVPGAAVALVCGQEAAGGAPGWLGPRGKTQLAAYLAGSLWRSRSVDVLVWVAARSRASALSGYAQAAAKLGPDYGGDAEAMAARVVAWLGGTSRRWLVVLDDLRDAADLEGLWPMGAAGRVLITAADPQRAQAALLVLERAGLVATDAAAVWVSRALQTAVRSVAPPELLDRAAQAAADALTEVWHFHDPGQFWALFAPNWPRS